MSTVTVTPSRNRRPRPHAELTFLRLVPGNTVVHRMWPGAKLLVAAMLALMLSISPTWATIGITGGVVVLALLSARIPLGAFPRLPRWFFGLLAIGAFLSLWSGQHPIAEVGSIDVSLGGLEEWARFLALAIVLLTSGAVIGWTTPLGEVAPAIRTLGRPFRLLRLPVDEWTVAIALAIRCLPLLIDEIRTLLAARSLRVHDPAQLQSRPRATVRHMFVEAHDVLATAIVMSIRRARDLAEAMVARGGIAGTVSATRLRPRFVDALVVLATAALAVVSLAVLHL